MKKEVVHLKPLDPEQLRGLRIPEENWPNFAEVKFNQSQIKLVEAFIEQLTKHPTKIVLTEALKRVGRRRKEAAIDLRRKLNNLGANIPEPGTHTGKRRKVENEIEQEVAKGRTKEQIAQDLGVGTTLVGNVKREKGLTDTSETQHREDFNKIVLELWNAGITTRGEIVQRIAQQQILGQEQDVNKIRWDVEQSLISLAKQKKIKRRRWTRQHQPEQDARVQEIEHSIQSTIALLLAKGGMVTTDGFLVVEGSQSFTRVMASSINALPYEIAKWNAKEKNQSLITTSMQTFMHPALGELKLDNREMVYVAQAAHFDTTKLPDNTLSNSNTLALVIGLVQAAKKLAETKGLEWNLSIEQHLQDFVLQNLSQQ
jgi:hypothetical protein